MMQELDAPQNAKQEKYSGVKCPPMLAIVPPEMNDNPSKINTNIFFLGFMR